MSEITSTTCYVVNKKPTKEIREDTFKLETKQLDEVKGSKVLLKVLYLSNDPAQRTWIQKGMDPERAYAPLPNEGDIMPARCICKVVQVGSEVQKWKEDDLVTASVGWTRYAVVEEASLQKAVQVPGHSEAIALGALGSTGLTAYYGLLEVGKASSSDKCIVVSGAAGATGSMVVQIAKKVLGIEKVIGLAGGKDKCDFVRSIGADHCIDYKTDTWKEELREATGRQAELYFDNVGGEILDTMLGLLKRHGRVVQCGMISTYNDMESGVVLKNYFEVISNRLSILGFIVIDAIPKAPTVSQRWPIRFFCLLVLTRQYIGSLVTWMKEGKIQVIDGKSETVKESKIEGIPEVWKLLFTGGNSGKLITKLID